MNSRRNRWIFLFLLHSQFQLSQQNTYLWHTNTHTHTCRQFYSCCKSVTICKWNAVHWSQFYFIDCCCFCCWRCSGCFCWFIHFSCVCVFSIRISLNLLRVWDALHKNIRQSSSSSTSRPFMPIPKFIGVIVKWWAMQWAVDTKLKRMTFTYRHIHLMFGDLNVKYNTWNYRCCWGGGHR